MESTRYDELFTDYSRWVQESRRQFFVSHILLPHAFDISTKFSESADSVPKGEILELAQKTMALTNARAFHLGIAIENATKARHIYDGHIESIEGKPKGLRTDHNILEHVRQCQVKLSPEETIFLERISYQTNSLAKYPIAKNVDSQNAFSGVIVG
ncbi:MAG: hypothetical protein V3S16_07575, partial [Candidatus Desulfatibia sp.]|uniref:hypothetical protein n=1 Tax=Candidatus Desulfatibia sp. TaxID=3101189 RepID=UPI002F31BEDC